MDIPPESNAFVLQCVVMASSSFDFQYPASTNYEYVPHRLAKRVSFNLFRFINCSLSYVSHYLFSGSFVDLISNLIAQCYSEYIYSIACCVWSLSLLTRPIINEHVSDQYGLTTFIFLLRVNLLCFTNRYLLSCYVGHYASSVDDASHFRFNPSYVSIASGDSEVWKWWSVNLPLRPIINEHVSDQYGRTPFTIILQHSSTG